MLIYKPKIFEKKKKKTEEKKKKGKQCKTHWKKKK